MLHPELRKAAARMPRGVLRAWTLKPLRALTAFLVWKRKPIPGVTITMHPLPGPTARVRVMRPAAASGVQPVLLWVHGGGYVLGTAAQDDAFCARLMAATGVSVVSVDYRLAPEHPWPAALDDCTAALDFLEREGRALGLDGSRLIIGGQSAGGGLAAALVLRMADTGRQAALLQLLSYPMIDDRTTQRQQSLDVRMWDETSNLRGWRAYLGRAPGGHDMTDLMAPARRAHLGGLPPAWIGVGTEDLFHDEDVTYAQRLQAAGVPCSLEVVPGAFHGFDSALPEATVSQKFFAAQCTAVRQALAALARPGDGSAVRLTADKPEVPPHR
jgi:acetyl esterase/lipase